MRLPANFHPPCARIVCVFVGIASATACASVGTATILPVGPITFSSNSDYDNNFKESPSFNGILRSIQGCLELSGTPTGIAVFDTSATGGASGQGGTNGFDANSDLSNFTMSADVASSVAGGIGVGFLFRLNSSEAGGYLAGAHFFPPFTTGAGKVAFDVFEGAGFTTAGSSIFHQEIPVPSTPLADTFYNFKVSVSGGAFSFDFNHGAATASFTDATVTATSGEAGIVLDAASPSAAARLDNLTIFHWPGDANGDGKVDNLDASILAANWLRSGGATRQMGDFNGDGKVNDLDASILAANWLAGVGAAVPEPGTLAMLAGLAAIGLLRRWRRA